MAWASEGPPPNRKVQPFVKLTGPYKVGTTQFFWVDKSRFEDFTSDPNDHRRVTVQVWYPTNVTGRRAPYLLNPAEFAGSQEDVAKLRTFNQYVLTRSSLDVPLATTGPGGRKFPILIFNPGGGHSRMSSSFVTEQLASHGFVVFSIEHYGDNMTTHWPDGTEMVLDRRPVEIDPDSRRAIENGTATKDEIIAAVVKSWSIREQFFFSTAVEDTLFVLNKIGELNDGGKLKSRFRNRLDLDRIGALGWSQGGAISIDLLAHDPRFMAAADMDGQFFGSNKARLSTHKPFLLLHAQPADNTPPNPNLTPEDQAFAELNTLIKEWFDHIIMNSTGPCFEARIEGTGHSHYADWVTFLSYGSPQLKAHARAREDVIQRFVVSFFRRFMIDENVQIPMSDPLVRGGKECPI